VKGGLSTPREFRVIQGKRGIKVRARCATSARGMTGPLQWGFPNYWRGAAPQGGEESAVTLVDTCQAKKRRRENARKEETRDKNATSP